LATASEDDATAALAAAGVRTRSLDEFTTIWALQRAKFGWLLGAGVSASAGVPLASSIRDRLLFDRYAVVHGLIRQSLDQSDPTQLARVHAYFDGQNGMPPLGSDSDYSAAFDLSLPDPSARKALLRELIEDVKPGYAQRVFGGFVVSGACDLAIMTNFDRLIEQGVNEAQRAGTDLNLPLQRELNVAGLDSTARAAIAIQERQWPLVVKLHGDFREKRLMNTDSELQQQDANLRQFINDVSRQFGLAVSGYSGRDRSVMQMLERTVRTPGAWPYGIWWLARPHSPIPDSVRNLLTLAANQGVAANLVVAASFDETMSALARQVVVDEPMRDYFQRLHPRPRPHRRHCPGTRGSGRCCGSTLCPS
jgi:SIR2-like domain